jgi:hypothetical protein
MRRVVSLLVVGPLVAVAGFYAATFAFLLITRLLVFAATVGVIGLYFLGIISSQNDIGAAPSLFLEWARSSVTAFYAVGSIGALAALTVVTRTVVAGPEASSSRRAIRTGAVAVGVAVLAAGVDWRYGVTPLVERLAPRADFAEAQRSVTCPLTVAEIAEGGSRANGCVTEVEGVLVYADGPRRLELHPEGAGTPSIRVYFFLGDRTLFGAAAPRLPPSYYDQVSEFVGKRVRIVGMTAPGQVRADIGHIVLADAQPPRVR